MKNAPLVISYRVPEPISNNKLSNASLTAAAVALVSCLGCVFLGTYFDGPPTDPLWVEMAGSALIGVTILAPIVGIVLGYVAINRTDESQDWTIRWGIAFCSGEFLLLLLLLLRPLVVA